MASSKKSALGRGFDSLIPTDVTYVEDFTMMVTPGESLEQIKVSTIKPNPNQPRRDFGEAELLELANSINEHGILQPIIVVKDADGYMIVAGERRYRAAQMLGLEFMPAVVKAGSDLDQLQIALVENIQREDLNPLETAFALARLAQEFAMTHEQIGKKVGKDSSTVNNLIRLTELPEEAKAALRSGTIVEGHARQIMALRANPEKQKELLDLIIRHGWTVRKSEEFVTAFKQGKTVASLSSKFISETPLTKKVSKMLKTDVFVQPMAKGRGRLIIAYKDEDHLNDIIKHLK